MTVLLLQTPLNDPGDGWPERQVTFEKRFSSFDATKARYLFFGLQAYAVPAGMDVTWEGHRMIVTGDVQQLELVQKYVTYRLLPNIQAGKTNLPLHELPPRLPWWKSIRQALSRGGPAFR